MKKKLIYPILITFIIVAGVLAFKSGFAQRLTTSSSPVENPSARVTQLANLTLSLENSDNAITAEQAGNLLFLWKGMRSLTESSTAADAEITALANQIESGMTEAQLAVASTVNTSAIGSSTTAAGSAAQGTTQSAPSGAAPAGIVGGMPGGDMMGGMMTAASSSGQKYAGTNVSQSLLEEVITMLEEKVL